MSEMYLTDFWYVACLSSEVKKGKTIALELLGNPVLIGRDDDGAAFAIKDICPHRGIPLRYGKFDGKEVQCCYHGWRFDVKGVCTAIPSLMPGHKYELQKIKCGNFPCREKYGLIFIFFAHSKISALPELPVFPGIEADSVPAVDIADVFDCNYDHAAFGLMDPTHAPFVHNSFWWRKADNKLYDKEKHYEPTAYGWKTVQHSVPKNLLVYKILGRNPKNEIQYALPGYRFELIKTDRNTVLGVTTITPIDQNKTQIRQLFYCTMSWVIVFKPVLKKLMRIFLTQDKDVIVQQQEGLKYNPSLKLIDDADTQAKWYALCKNAYIRAQESGEKFQNPIKTRALRWKS